MYLWKLSLPDYCRSRELLALRADIRAPLCNPDFLDPGSTAKARLTRSPMNGREAVDRMGDVVDNLRAPLPDSFGHHVRNMADNLAALHGTNSAGWCSGVYARSPQHFIHIDVAETGDKGLIEKKRFDGNSATAHFVRQRFGIEFTHGFRTVTKCFQRIFDIGGFHDSPPSKLTDVGVLHNRGISERDGGVCRLVRILTFRFRVGVTSNMPAPIRKEDGPLARQFEMQHQGEVVIKTERQHLGSPAGCQQCRTDEDI